MQLRVMFDEHPKWEKSLISCKKLIFTFVQMKSKTRHQPGKQNLHFTDSLFQLKQKKEFFCLTILEQRNNLFVAKESDRRVLNWWNNLTWTNETVRVTSILKTWKKIFHIAVQFRDNEISWPFLSEHYGQKVFCIPVEKCRFSQFHFFSL